MKWGYLMRTKSWVVNSRKLSILAIGILMLSSNVYGQSDTTIHSVQKKVSFKDSLDGAFDISEFLKTRKGFMFVPVIVTEPAVGYGGGGALLFFHPNNNPKNKTKIPNITGVMGLATENKTWAAGAMHFHVFGDDKVRTLTILAKPDVFIKYYGQNNEFLSNHPVTLNLNAFLAVQRAQLRLGESRWFVGGQYMFFQTSNSIDTIPNKPLINKLLDRVSGVSTISMVQPMVVYDNRDNIFSPTKGFNTGIIFSYNATWLGADDDYYKLNPFLLVYTPVVNKLYFSFRLEENSIIGDAPDYALPFVQLRGIPAMQYQSNNTVMSAMQWRYQLYGRWSVLAFTGAGKAFEDFNEFNEAEWVYDYGTGFRYEIARQFGIQTGLDFAWGNGDEFAFYIVFGTSWNK